MKTKTKLNVKKILDNKTFQIINNIAAGKILIAAVICFVFVGNAGAGDWPMFRHDSWHTGETSDVIKNPKDLELEWKFKTGDLVYSSPAVSGNYVYVGSNDNYIYCLDKNTGELKWKFKTGSYVKSSPAVSGDYVYVGSIDSYVYCLNKDTGELEWKFKTGGRVDSSPAVSGDYVYVSGNLRPVGSMCGHRPRSPEIMFMLVPGRVIFIV